MKLDPNNGESWNLLGHLCQRVGQLQQAEIAYKKLKAIAKAPHNKVMLAAAQGNLGNVYGTLGDLAHAEGMYNKAVTLFHVLGASPEVQRVQALLDNLNKG